MKLLVKRVEKKELYTIGRLYIDGTYFCDTLEDKDRGLCQKMALSEVLRLKQKGITAIPVGTYQITLDVVSPKYSTRSAYSFCKGKLPRLINVPGYEGILIHIGNKHEDTEGCILVGRDNNKGNVINSTDTFKALYSVLQEEWSKNKDIQITIE